MSNVSGYSQAWAWFLKAWVGIKPFPKQSDIFIES